MNPIPCARGWIWRIRFLVLLGLPLVAATALLPAQNRVRGQVTDAVTTLPVEGATVTVDPDGAPISATTDPFGFYEITGIADGTWAVEAEHPSYVTGRNDALVLPDATFGAVGTANFQLDLKAELNRESIFDLYIQVNDAVTAWGLSGCPVRLQRFASAGDASPVEDRVIRLDDEGSHVLYGAQTGHYRFLVNQPGPGSRDRWEAFTSETTALDKAFIDQSHTVQLYLKPIEQEIVVNVTWLDFFFTNQGPLEDAVVSITGYDPRRPAIEVIPVRSIETGPGGSVVFRGLPGVTYLIDVGKIGYVSETHLVEPDADGDLADTLDVDLKRVEYNARVRVEHDYQPDFIGGYEVLLEGYPGTETADYSARQLNGGFFDPSSEITFFDLEPGKYRATIVDFVESSIALDGEPFGSFTETFRARATGEVVFEVITPGTTTVELPIRFEPVLVRGQLQAADVLGAPDDQPLFAPLAGKTVTFVEKAEVAILPDDARSVSVVTDNRGRYEVTLLPGIYGIRVDEVPGYVGSHISFIPIITEDESQRGLADRQGWPIYEAWPYGSSISSSARSVFDHTGFPIGRHAVMELDLKLRRERFNFLIPVGTSDTENPTQYLVLGVDGGSEYAVDYQDLTVGTAMLLPDGGGDPIVGELTLNDDLFSGGPVGARFEEIPPGEYTVSLDHPRWNFIPQTFDGEDERVGYFDFPDPGRAPAVDPDQYWQAYLAALPVNLNGGSGYEAQFKPEQLGEFAGTARYWNENDQEYSDPQPLDPRYATVNYVPGLFTAASPFAAGTTSGYTYTYNSEVEAFLWYAVGPGITTYYRGAGDSGTATPPTALGAPISARARLSNDPNVEVAGVHFAFNSDPFPTVRQTPVTIGGFQGDAGVFQQEGDNWIWDNTAVTVTTAGGSPEVAVLIEVTQGMEIRATVTNESNGNPLAGAPVEVLTSNGTPLRGSFGSADFARMVERTDDDGKVTFNSIPGYRDYFLRIEIPGYQDRLFRLDATAAAPGDDSSTALMHDVTVGMVPLTGPSNVTADVPFNRYGGFLPGVTRSGDQSAFDGFAARDTLTATWELQLNRRTHDYMVPAFDTPEGQPQDAVAVSTADDIREVWLVDMREFEPDFGDDEPAPFDFLPDNNPRELLQQLHALKAAADSPESPKKVWFSRSTTVEPVGGESFRATGTFDLSTLPPGDFDPHFYVVSKLGAVTAVTDAYAGDKAARRLTGLPVPGWLAFAFDIIGFTAGVNATQEEIKKVVPNGRYLPFPEFSAEIKENEDDDMNKTGFVDYAYALTLLQSEGQESPGSDLTGLAAGFAGAKVKAEAKIDAPGEHRQISLEIGATVSDITLEGDAYKPKMLGGLAPTPKLEAMGAVANTATRNVDSGEPFDLRLSNTISMAADVSVEVNLDPVLSKIPYAGPVLAAANATGLLSFFADISSGVSLEKEFKFETLKPPSDNSTTTDPDPRAARTGLFSRFEPEGINVDLTDTLGLRARIGVRAEGGGERYGAKAGIGLTGPEVAGQPSLKFEPNSFGDWPPYKRVQGSVTLDASYFIKLPVKEIKKEVTWDAIKIDVQFGTESVFQLIPMETLTTVTDITLLAAPDFRGDALRPVREFSLLGGQAAGDGGVMFYVETDSASGTMSLRMAGSDGGSWTVERTIVEDSNLLFPRVIRLDSGNYLVVWAKSLDPDDPFATGQILAAEIDRSDLSTPVVETVSFTNAVPSALEVGRSGAMVGVAWLQPYGISATQLLGAKRNGSSWDFQFLRDVGAHTGVAVTGGEPGGPDALHVHYTTLGGEAGYLAWTLSGGVAGSGVLDATFGGRGFTGVGSPDGVYRFIGIGSDGVGRYFSASGATAGYSMKPDFALAGNAIEMQGRYLDNGGDPRILLVWSAATFSGTELFYAILDPAGSLLDGPHAITENATGSYSQLRVARESASRVRVTTLYENSPIELRTFLIDLASGLGPNDSDGDGLNDLAELRLIDASASDAVAELADVRSGDDFDGDGFSNGEELEAGTDPVDPERFPQYAGITITADSPYAHEFGLRPGFLAVKRPQADTGSAVTVLYGVSGTATPEIDYTALPGMVDLTAGSASQLIAVSPLADAQAEGDETVQVDLTADAAYELGSRTSAVVTVRDRPMDAWRFDRFAPDPDGAGTGEADDPDGDGIPNLLEYALVLEPGVPDAVALPELFRLVDEGTGEAYVAIRYFRPAEAEELEYVVEVADSLAPDGWDDSPGATVVVSELPADPGMVEVWVRDATPAGSAAARFIRLRISRLSAPADD